MASSLAQPPTTTSLPILTCFAAPYSLTGLLLHLLLTTSLLRIAYLHKRPLPLRYLTRTSTLHNHRFNAFLCIFYGLTSFLIQISAFSYAFSDTASARHGAKFTLAEFGIAGYFAVAAMLPVFVGALMAGACLRMRAEEEKERLGVLFRAGSNRGEAEALVGFAYIVALGFGVNDMLGFMEAENRDLVGVRGICYAVLGLLGVWAVVLGCFVVSTWRWYRPMAESGDIWERFCTVGKWLGQFIARLWLFVFGVVAAASVVTPLLMDVVLGLVEEEDRRKYLGLPVGRDGKVVTMWVMYVVVAMLPQFCTRE